MDEKTKAQRSVRGPWFHSEPLVELGTGALPIIHTVALPRSPDAI